MYKKFIRPILIILLVGFSFFYTEKSIDLIRNTDPLMQQIKDSNYKYEIEPINAIIKDDTIIPGISGLQIDYEKTYTNMKTYGTYNESLTNLEETKPTISIDNYYDKYIIQGNKNKKSVALVFKVEKDTNINKLIQVLNNENIKVTFFIDGIYLEENYKNLEIINNHELELLSYDNSYDEITFTSSLSYLRTLTNKSPKYCYAEYDNKEIIELCSKLKLHTIIPTIKIKTNPYKEIKENLTNSAIISIPITNTYLNELQVSIKYIKSKGYSFKTLEELLSESLEK